MAARESCRLTTEQREGSVGVDIELGQADAGGERGKRNRLLEYRVHSPQFEVVAWCAATLPALSPPRHETTPDLAAPGGCANGFFKGCFLSLGGTGPARIRLA